jgi:hypothetical protein
MREDVKKKHLSTPLRKDLDWCLHPGPFFFVERVLVLTLGAPPSATGIRIAVAGLPLERFHAAVPTPFVAKLRKPKGNEEF